MKKIIVLLFSLYISWDGMSQVSCDTIACKIFEKKINVVRAFIDQEKPDFFLVSKAVEFLTFFTGITSESTGDFIGQHNPTKSDYDRWVRWYIINKGNIYWDKNLRTIFIHKGIKLDSEPETE